MADCIFCKIVSRQIPSDIIEETEDIAVIKDINPKASIHFLIVPKKHIKDVQSFMLQDFFLASKMFSMAQKLSSSIEGAKDFRLIVNSGPGAGQCVFHMHMHFLAGKSIPTF